MSVLLTLTAIITCKHLKMTLLSPFVNIGKYYCLAEWYLQKEKDELDVRFDNCCCFAYFPSEKPLEKIAKSFS